MAGDLRPGQKRKLPNPVRRLCSVTGVSADAGQQGQISGRFRFDLRHPHPAASGAGWGGTGLSPGRSDLIYSRSPRNMSRNWNRLMKLMNSDIAPMTAVLVYMSAPIEAA